MKRLRLLWILPILMFLLILSVHRTVTAQGVPKNQRIILMTSVLVPSAPRPVSTCSNALPHCTILSWAAPTKNTDGTSIVGTVTYNVFRSATNGGPYAQLNLTPVSLTTYEDDSVVGGQTYFYVVTAVVGTVSSANSAQVTSLIPASVPNPPTALVVTSQ